MHCYLSARGDKQDKGQSCGFYVLQDKREHTVAVLKDHWRLFDRRRQAGW